MFANTYIELKRFKHQQRAIAGLWQYDRLRCQHGRHHVRQHAMMTLAFSAVGLQLTTAGGITLAVKIRAACEQLGIDGTGLTVSAALRACSKEAGIEQSGPIIAQTDHLVEQLGISFDASPPLGEEPGTEATSHQPPCLCMP